MSDHPVADGMAARSWVPWNRPGEWLIWLFALIIATLFIHNFTQWAGGLLPDRDGGS